MHSSIIRRPRIISSAFGSLSPATAAPSEGTVLFDASGVTPQTGGLVTSTSWSAGTPINVGGGANGTANMFMVAALILDGAAGGTSSGPSLNWDTFGTNQPMTLITGAHASDAGGEIWLFGLLNPTLGPKTFLASWSVANEAMLLAATFVNVDQSGVNAGSVPNIFTNTGSGTSASVSTSVAPTTRKIFAAYNTPNNFSAASGTDIGHDNTGIAGSGAANWDVGSAPSMSYSLASAAWAAVAVALKGH